MKIFTDPEMNISRIDVLDIITASGNEGIMDVDANDLLGWAGAAE